MTFGVACGIMRLMNTTTNTNREEKSRTRNVLNSVCKEWVKTFVHNNMVCFFGSETIGSEVAAKIVKDVMSYIGQFSDYSNTRRITEQAAFAGLQKRILRSIGIHVDDEEIMKGAQTVVDRLEENREARKSQQQAD